MTIANRQHRSAAARDGRDPASGFTLVEMLVVIVILLVLTSVTVTLVNVSLDGERVKSGSRQLQSLLMGARDRAVYQKLPRGVRFEIDPQLTRSEDTNNNGSLDAGEDLNGNGSLDLNLPVVRSMVYIGASRNWSQGLVTVHRNPANNGQPDLLRGEFTEWFVLRFGEDLNRNGMLDGGEDRNGNGLLDLGPLVDGARIKLGGRWYTILSTATLTVSDEWLRISPPLADPRPTDEPYLAAPTRPIAARFDEGDYEMTLMPRVLPNARPLELPPGVLIDLVYSRLPSTLWLSNGFRYRDIMFSPRGSVVGSTASAGVIHFLLNDQVDITNHRTPWSTSNEGDRRVVSLFTRTGNVTTSELFPGEVAIGVDIDSNGTIDAAGPRNLFYYAEVGEVSE